MENSIEHNPTFPQLNAPAPHFDAATTHGPRTNEDYKGRWLVLSIDSYYSHLAWVRNIKEKFGDNIPFPIIADLDMKVAKSYGMIHPRASARCLTTSSPHSGAQVNG